MTEIMRIPVKVAAATTTFTVGVTAATTLVVFAFQDRIDVHAGAAAVLGSLVGGVLGVRLQSAPAARPGPVRPRRRPRRRRPHPPGDVAVSLPGPPPNPRLGRQRFLVALPAGVARPRRRWRRRPPSLLPDDLDRWAGWAHGGPAGGRARRCASGG